MNIRHLSPDNTAFKCQQSCNYWQILKFENSHKISLGILVCDGGKMEEWVIRQKGEQAENAAYNQLPPQKINFSVQKHRRAIH